MKQKYVLNIADLQINVVTSAPAEDVEKISGMLDRKMREIYALLITLGVLLALTVVLLIVSSRQRKRRQAKRHRQKNY